ncbi:uncharacterized protein LTR77_005524 [Saxophila tyrrhenica]|uniref:DASH complex subunit DUO1 n=1 Tax=Saxophila tyrrhenica TaxID=1690608 RepID=A0AAV9P9J0_9PEZI|nr:hypothetical protein LTR77_005524 [Saxophila tyrrhenica]
MDKHSRTPSIAKLSLQDQQPDDEDAEDLFASPESGATTSKHTPTSQPSTSGQKPPHGDSRARQQQHEEHEARLRAELARVREVNTVIENVTASLHKAQSNMSTVHSTVQHASTLLATWTRILSQTEHNQRLILNPAWGGASKDLEEMEEDEARRRQEQERRAAEEERRREEAVRRAEEEERRRAASVATGASGKVAGRGRGMRGASSGYGRVAGQAGRGRGATGTSSSTRGGSGIARSGSTRGRGRGLG